ncbi:MAG: acyl-CoA dehydratase activase-related protein, partial [Desulfovibrionales bacterium]|nr:acyl-CoA dehydratase activase-related protein [Desulfovibrionales bacterium]
MVKTVGIPRCLFYYNYFPGWNEFFHGFGAKVILSPPTNKKILDLGVQQAVDEVCLPVKLFFGHVEILKKKVDYLFVPRIMSVTPKEWICPKFLG